jgi:protein ImuB
VGSKDRVGAPELLDSHRRDAFRVRHFAEPTLTSNERTLEWGTQSFTRIALRVLRPAEPVYVQAYHGRPQQFVFRSEQYQVVECYGPWNSSGDWWGPEKWARAQWDVVASSRSGRPLCCQLSAGLEAWWVEAVYD